MIVIRLTRIGKRNAPQYRIVVQEKQRSPSSKYIDQVGFYNPLTEPADIKFDEEKVKEWIEKGAEPSNTVWNLLVNAGIVKGKKRKAVKVKTQKPKEGESASAEASADEGKEKKEEKKPEDKPKEEPKKDEKPEDKKEEKPAEKKPKEEPKKEEKPKEDKKPEDKKE